MTDAQRRARALRLRPAAGPAGRFPAGHTLLPPYAL